MYKEYLAAVSLTVSGERSSLLISGVSKEEKEYFTKKTEVIGDKEYTVKIIADAYGKKTMSYVRKGAYYFYQYDPRTSTEGVLVPINPKMGETWISADKSMKYEVIALEQRFQTPVKKYKKAIWIKGIPNRNPYGIQRAKQYLHYVRGEGLVAMTDARGEFLKYLSEIDK